MKTIIIALSLFILTNLGFAQSGWIDQSPTNTSSLFHGVYFINSNTGFVVGDNGILLKTINGGVDWIIKSSGTTKSLHKITFASTQIGIIIGENGTILRSTNSGDNWSIIPSGLPNSVSGTCNKVTFTNETTGFIASCSGMLKSTNAGLSWALVYPSSTYLYGCNFINANTGIAIGDNSLIIRTTNGGTNWSVLSIGGFNYQLCAVTSTNENIFYLVGGIQNSSSFMIRSSNFGDEWVLMNPPADNRLNSIQFANSATGYIAGSGSIVLKTTNSGINWVRQTVNTNRDLWDVSVISPLEAVISGKSGGIFRTNNGGITGIIANNTTIPDNFELQQNYPNPFNPSTTIKFNLPQSSKTVLKIFNIKGEEVANLVDHNLNAGNYSVDWNASTFNSGTYFYKLETVQGILTKKMILVK